MSDLLVPIAVSSQLDVTGEERIHAAKYTANVRPVFTVTPWTPAALSLGLWLKADAPSNKITVDGSGLVTVWADDSGFGRDMTLAAGGPTPGIGPTLSTYNGHRTVIDTPPNDYALYSFDAGLMSMFNDIDSMWTMVMCRPEPTDRFTDAVLAWYGTGGGDYRVHASGDSTPEVASTYGGWVNLTDVTYNFGQGAHIYGSEFVKVSDTATTLISRVDGGTASTNARTGKSPQSAYVTSVNRVSVMGDFGHAYNGQVMEVIAGVGELTLADRQKLEGYLAWKWTGTDSDLVALLPSDHPYKLAAPSA